MDNFTPLNLPTKPYLKAYLHALYGSPVIFNADNYFGIVMMGLLERPVRHQESPKVLKFRVFDKFDSTITIYLPKWWLTKYQFGHSLSNNHIISINKLFEQRFEEDLFKHCNLASIYKIDIKKAIEQFCVQHLIVIEEDISYDALKKKEYRYRKEKEKTAELSPKKPFRNPIPNSLFSNGLSGFKKKFQKNPAELSPHISMKSGYPSHGYSLTVL